MNKYQKAIEVVDTVLHHICGEERETVCNDCREEHKQLAEWLEELKEYKAKERKISAREMFEALGYKYRELDDDVFQYSMSSSIVIRFYKKEREFCSVEYFEPKDITVDEFKAIQKQMEEMGWI